MAKTMIASLLDDAPVSSGVTGRPPTIPVTPAQLAVTVPPATDPEALLRVRVVWGDLTRTAADIHIVGHYQGVLPASSERALDSAVSSQRGIIAEHTRRRWLVGELGEISYFPGADEDGDRTVAVRRAAVAGMGRLGTFNEARAEQLYTSLLRELGSLPSVRTAALVLIGSGAGNLSVPMAARALTKGITALLTGPRPACGLQELAVVEIDRLRAEQLHVALANLLRESPAVALQARVDSGGLGRVGTESAAVFAIRALAQALRKHATELEAEQHATPVRQPAKENGRRPARRRSNSVLAQLDAALGALPDGLREQIPQKLAEIPDDIDALAVVLGQPSGSDRVTPPTRIAVSNSGDRMLWAALTERSTIPERDVPAKPRLVADLVQRLTAPNADDAVRLPQMMRRWIVPVDFQDHISEATPLVFDVDAEAAKLPWEFLTDAPYDAGERPLPLALRTPIARQLRTAYARAATDYQGGAGLRALVIADPGPIDQRLPGARQEGLEVAALLRDRGVEVAVFAGAPVPEVGVREATELDVLSELLLGRYDIVHFAGHGTMPDPRRPEAGWLFADGVLSARDLAQLTWAPRLVTANACWTAAQVGGPATTPAQQAQQTQPAQPMATSEAVQRARLTAVLADEFLRVGVAHYIGTSWEIPDGMGARFATCLYDRLLPVGQASGASFGRAICDARQVLFSMCASQATTGVAQLSPQALSAWAAYQHYGDPADVVEPFERTAEERRRREAGR
jgi:CHAT domain